jgi:hypothetical protein
MKSRCLCGLFYAFAAFLGSFSTSLGQFSEYGSNIYSTMYIGDLTHQNTFIYSIRAGVGAHFRRHLTRNLSIRSDINLARISGSDNSPYVRSQTRLGRYSEFFVVNDAQQLISSYDPNIYLRNLSFRSILSEATFIFEWKFRELMINSSQPRANFYFFGGASVFYFNPEAQSDSGDLKWFPLKTFTTEGQGTVFYPNVKSYRSTQIAVPLGLGVRWTLNKFYRFSTELGYRITFTDYLDDVSGKYVDPLKIVGTHGNRAGEFVDRSSQLHPYLAGYFKEGSPRGSRGNDAYLFLGFSISRVIYPYNCPKF